MTYLGIKNWALLCLTLWLSMPGFLYSDVRISATAENNTIYENSPLNILVMISHRADDTIDEDSFQASKKPVKAELQKQEVMSASTDRLLSIYKVTLPAQPKGAHLLPVISVTVSGKSYKSAPSTYEVSPAPTGDQAGNKTQAKPAKATPAAPQRAASQVTPTTSTGEIKGKATLELKPFIEGPKEIFPGQKITVGYRYIYNTSLDTTAEQVPLLQASGLIKVGGQNVKEDQQGEYSILEISQIVQGDKPGTYTFGPSVLEGLPYTLAAGGQKVYAKEKLTSTAGPVTITVKPFPTEQKPGSFTGSTGQFTWDIKLVSSPKVNVGDAIQLLITAVGKEGLDNLTLPELCCQPGISGLFRLGDLPPVGKIEGDSKKFTVEMRVLSAAVKEVPSLEFSSFNPDTGQYNVFHSQPIPLSVTSVEDMQEPALKQAEAKSESEEPTWQTHINTPSALEIEGFYPLEVDNLYNKWFGSWWSLFLVPFGIGFMMFQHNLIRYLAEQKHALPTENSEDFFLQALKAKDGSIEQYSFFEKALLLRLFEKGKIAHADLNLEDLPDQGIAGNVRAFLLKLQESRYSGRPVIKQKDITAEAKALFNSIV